MSFLNSSSQEQRESYYYHLSDHIYVTQFRNELIVLDTKRDKYMICFQEVAELLFDLLERKELSVSTMPFSKEPDVPTECPTTIGNLLDNQIIEAKDTSFPFYIDRKLNSDGVSNVDWSLPLENKKIGINFDVLKALITLIKINFYIKVRGFYSTIRLIKQSRKHNVFYIIPSREQLQDLATTVNKACLIYPTRTKCLEWAMTFVLLALKRGWKCNLEVGVQNYPFMAHAWVECEGQVVMDSQDLREGLGIILNEPFRKVKV